MLLSIIIIIIIRVIIIITMVHDHRRSASKPFIWKRKYLRKQYHPSWGSSTGDQVSEDSAGAVGVLFLMDLEM